MRERYLYETKNAGVGAAGPNRDLYQERLELAGIAGTTYEPYQRKSHHRWNTDYVEFENHNNIFSIFIIYRGKLCPQLWLYWLNPNFLGKWFGWISLKIPSTRRNGIFLNKVSYCRTQHCTMDSEGVIRVEPGKPGIAGRPLHYRPQDSWQAVWSTLIARAPTLLRSHWSRASLVLLAPAVLCHKEPARASKAP